MVVINPLGEIRPHTLVAKKQINGMAPGDIKKVAVQKMTDGRFGVFAYSYVDDFHIVIKDESELHATFNEQTALAL